jgi:hypothetical protein
MNKVLFSVGGLVVGLMVQAATDDCRARVSEPPGQRMRYKFHCWLCSGETFFEETPHPTCRLQAKRPCKWCGMDNDVNVLPSGQPA